jgi:hypothetical protein
LKLSTLGFTPRISGRPSREVAEIPTPSQVTIELNRRGIEYSPVPGLGTGVSFGEPLGRIEIDGGVLDIPSPVSGTIREIEEESGNLVIDVTADETRSTLFDPLKAQYAAREQIVDSLRRGGVWPAIWSSATEGISIREAG